MTDSAPRDPDSTSTGEDDDGNTVPVGDDSPGAGVVGPDADAPEVPEPNEPA